MKYCCQCLSAFVSSNPLVDLCPLCRMSDLSAIAQHLVEYQPPEQAPSGSVSQPPTPRAHNHYFKDVSRLEVIDVYRVLGLFDVTDPCLQHAIKKLLVAGGRGVKDVSRDIQEAIDTLTRWQQLREEDARS